MKSVVAKLRDARSWWLDGVILAALAGLASFMLSLSWRKWVDPLVDYGREVYMPWRVMEGGVFGRDFSHPHGPLSTHVNALAFRVAGAEIMTLVWLNLVIYGGILLTAYVLLRRGWGRLGAALGGGVFVVVFSFSQLTGTANYNYATPYSHEAVHGLWVCIGLVLALTRWRETRSAVAAGAAGLLYGATVVLKFDCFVSATLVTGAGAVLHWRDHGWKGFGRRGGAFFAGGAVLPLIFFSVVLALNMPLGEAVRTAGQAVFNALLDSRFTTDECQRIFTGIDQPWLHFQEHVLATAGVVAVLGLVAAGVRLVAREMEVIYGWRWLGWAGFAAVAAIAGGIAWRAATLENGPGHALLGMCLLVVLAAVWRLWRGGLRTEEAVRTKVRILVGVLGAAMMLRMVLNGRVAHYGFYQAAMAGMVVAASICADWPAWAGREGRRRWLATAVMVVLVGAWAGRLANLSASLLKVRTYEVGEAGDRMLYFPPQASAASELLRTAVMFARQKIAPGEKLLVLPEGLMVNYLARRAAPAGPDSYFGAYLKGGREAAFVRRFRADPPQWVMLVSRDLREHGVQRYGGKMEQGELLLRWVLERYELVVQAGDDPLDPDKRGLRIYRLKPN